jgi:hypothetical protein
MNKLVDDLTRINKFEKDLKGVFTLADLKVIFPAKTLISFYRRIKALEKVNILKRYIRGIYISENFDLKLLSYKINPNSYISFERVLSDSLMIGSMPTHEIRAVKVGKKREFTTDQGRIIFLGIAKDLYFGFKKIEGINIATKEKAFLDTLYFYLKGLKYYFDIYSDIDTKKLDINIIREYLKAYHNPKFISFVRNYLNGNTIS